MIHWDHYREIIEALLNTGGEKTAAPTADTTSWWQEVFVPGQLLPFVALFADGIEPEKINPLLYKTRNFFHASQDIHPTSQDLDVAHERLMDYAENQWFVFSLDGGAFVACNAPPSEFFRRNMPDHLGKQYFLLFLLTLYNTFANQAALGCGSAA